MSRTAFEYALELNQTNLTTHVNVYGGAGPAELMGDVAAVHVRPSSLARLWRDQIGQPKRNIAPPVYGWFTEGFDTPDLRAARALMEELVAA